MQAPYCATSACIPLSVHEIIELSVSRPLRHRTAPHLRHEVSYRFCAHHAAAALCLRVLCSRLLSLLSALLCLACCLLLLLCCLLSRPRPAPRCCSRCAAAFSPLSPRRRFVVAAVAAARSTSTRAPRLLSAALVCPVVCSAEEEMKKEDDFSTGPLSVLMQSVKQNTPVRANTRQGITEAAPSAASPQRDRCIQQPLVGATLDGMNHVHRESRRTTRGEARPLLRNARSEADLHLRCGG